MFLNKFLNMQLQLQTLSRNPVLIFCCMVHKKAGSAMLCYKNVFDDIIVWVFTGYLKSLLEAPPDKQVENLLSETRKRKSEDIDFEVKAEELSLVTIPGNCLNPFNSTKD